MSKSKAPIFLGLSAAGGIGYYLYSAGGNPKAAEAKFESTSTSSLAISLAAQKPRGPNQCVNR